VVKRRRVRRKKAGCQEQAHCGGLTNAGLLSWWDDAVSDVWDTAAGVLGVAQGTLSQEDAEARMASLPGGPQPSAVRRRTSTRSLAASANQADGAIVAPPRTPSSFRRCATLDAQTGEEVGGGKSGLEGDGDIPGLDFLYRIYAPRELIQRYEALEKEVVSPDFKLYSAQDQAEALEDLAVTQGAIEAKENRLNGAMALIGCIHGCYVGLMASLLVVFVPQTCPRSASYALEHTCTLYENTHNLSQYEATALALNIFTLFLVLLTETLVFRREQFLDNVLSYNPRKPANNLSAEPPDGSPSVLEQHPYVAHMLLWQNLTAGNLARTTCAMVLVNLLVSSVLILGYNSNGSSSIVSLVTNTMLLGSKLLFSAVVCLRSSSNKNGTSLYKVCAGARTSPRSVSHSSRRARRWCASPSTCWIKTSYGRSSTNPTKTPTAGATCRRSTPRWRRQRVRDAPSLLLLLRPDATPLHASSQTATLR